MSLTDPPLMCSTAASIEDKKNLYKRNKDILRYNKQLARGTELEPLENNFDCGYTPVFSTRNVSLPKGTTSQLICTFMLNTLTLK